MPEIASKDGWTRVAFGDVVRLSRERSSDPEKDGFDRYVGLEHIKPGDLKVRRWGDISDGTTFTNIFRSGQVLFGKRRAYQRKVAVADFDGVCSGDIYVLEPNDERLLLELLPFVCQTDGFFQHAVGTSAGSLSPRTNWESLASYELALPPPEEQERIVKILRGVEAAIESALRTAAAAVAVRKSLARKLFTADLNARTRVLGSLIQESRYGPRFSSTLYDDNGSLAQLRTTDIDEEGSINYGTIPRAGLDPADFTEHLLRDRDLVISRSGTTGITALFRDHGIPTIPAAFLIRLRTSDDLLPEYLHEYLSSAPGRQMTASLSRGGVQKNINGSQLLDQSVPCPKRARQQRVVDDILSVRLAERAIVERVVSLRTFKAVCIRQILEVDT